MGAMNELQEAVEVLGRIVDLTLKSSLLEPSIEGPPGAPDGDAERPDPPTGLYL